MKDDYTTNSHYLTSHIYYYYYYYYYYLFCFFLGGGWGVHFELGSERAEKIIVSVSHPPLYRSAGVANGSRMLNTVIRTIFAIQMAELLIINCMRYLGADMPGRNCRAFPFSARPDSYTLPSLSHSSWPRSIEPKEFLTECVRLS